MLRLRRFVGRWRTNHRDARANGHTWWWSIRWGVKVAWALR
jgi:hypothetical protein